MDVVGLGTAVKQAMNGNASNPGDITGDDRTDWRDTLVGMAVYVALVLVAIWLRQTHCFKGKKNKAWTLGAILVIALCPSCYVAYAIFFCLRFG